MSSTDRDLRDYGHGGKLPGQLVDYPPYMLAPGAAPEQEPAFQSASPQAAGASTTEARQENVNGNTADSQDNASDTRTTKLLDGRFEVVKAVKLGFSQQVHRALDRRKLKFEGIDPFVSLIHIPGHLADDTAALTPLLASMRQWQGLKHPGVVQVSDLFRNTDGAFITAEHLEGRSLAHHLTNVNAEVFPAETALSIINALGSVLVMAHARGVSHGSISPSSVWLRQNNRPQLVDPGTTILIAAGERYRLDADARPGISERAYGNAEAVTLMDVSQTRQAQSDVYALACIGYELLTGQHPFNGLTAAEARMSGSQVQLLPPLTQRQWQAFSDALALHPSQRRISSVQDFLGRLNGTSIRHVFSGSALIAAMVTGALFATLVLSMGHQHQPRGPQLANAPEDYTRSDENATANTDDVLMAVIHTPDESTSDDAPDSRAANNDIGMGEEEVEALEVDAPEAELDGVAAPIETIATTESQAPVTVQVTTRATVTSREQIGELLRQASQQIARHQYTEPRGGSAIDSYREILRLDPANRDAVQGIKDLSTQLHHLAQRALQRHEYAAAKALLDMERTVDPHAEGLQNMNAQAATANRRADAPAASVSTDDLALESDPNEFEQQAEMQAPDYVEQIAEEKL